MRFTTLAAAAPLILAAGQAAANNGHFMVDHAVIADPGNCQMESWFSRQSRDGFDVDTLVGKPACTIGSGWQFALPVAYRLDDSELLSTGLEAKSIMARGRNFGAIAVTLGTQYSHLSDRIERSYVNIPWSAETGPGITWHLNAGMSHRRSNSNIYTNWGLGVSIAASDAVDLILEGAANGSDSPIVAAGVRFHASGVLEIDASIGRDNEREVDRATIGLNFRF
jgi:hypothetical protein